MWKSLVIFSGLASLTACAENVPREVRIPVPVPCPEAQITPAGSRERLPLEDVTPETPADVAARAWKASLMLLLGYVGRVEIERDGYRDAYNTCRQVGSSESLQPSPEPPTDR